MWNVSKKGRQGNERRAVLQLGGDRLEQQQWQRQDGDVRDQAKQWLSAGRDWLSGASKKVAQAVKETQAQINSRLEELDARHSQGEACSISSWASSSTAHSVCTSRHNAIPFCRAYVMQAFKPCVLSVSLYCIS